MSINRVTLTGAASAPKLTYNEQGKPECRLQLTITESGRDGQRFNVYVPLFIYGPGAETAAEQVEAGDLIGCDGRLGWKSTLKRDGSKIGLCITSWGVEVLSKAAAEAVASE